jgi:predicted phage terminase large subunit-like protein
MFVDPAQSKNKRADYTTICVIGVSEDGQSFLIDMARDRIDVFERFELLTAYHKSYKPEVIWYEIQGLNSDVEVIEREMQKRNYYMVIEKFSTNLNNSKHRRIMTLGGLMRRGEFLIPRELMYGGRDMIEEFVNEEYTKYPNNRYHDDMLDCMAMHTSVKVTAPEHDKETPQLELKDIRLGSWWKGESQGSWMTGFTGF